MADKKAAVASGADPAGDAARRRNVPGPITPGAPAQQPEVDEKKVHGKKKVQAHQILWAFIRATGLQQFAYRKPRYSIYSTSGNLS